MATTTESISAWLESMAKKYGLGPASQGAPDEAAQSGECGTSEVELEEPAPEPDLCEGPSEPQETDQPDFKGYPSTLEKAETLIGQVNRYGFSEGLNATSMDPANRGDVQEIWCSGLSNWALAEAGQNLDEPIPGKFFYEQTTKKNKKTGENETVVTKKPVTLRLMVEGSPEALCTDPEHPFVKGVDPYAAEGLFGATPAEDSPKVKGAAGAFVEKGIGKEITDLEDVKPGDFAQTRQVGAGLGHAFQIHACTCEGECLIGPKGAPTLIKDLGGEQIETPDGIWHGKASFRIDGNTNPRYVGAHKVVKSDWLESNVASAMEDKSDKDGGVQIRHGAKFEDPSKGGKRTYIGRLSSSSWSGYSRNSPLLPKPEPQTCSASNEEIAPPSP